MPGPEWLSRAQRKKHRGKGSDGKSRRENHGGKLFKLLRMLEAISASFAANGCDRASMKNSVLSLGRGETKTEIEYEILSLSATAERPALVDPGVLMLLE